MCPPMIRYKPTETELAEIRQADPKAKHILFVPKTEIDPLDYSRDELNVRAFPGVLRLAVHLLTNPQARSRGWFDRIY